MTKLPVPLRSKQRNWYDARTHRPGRRTFSAETKRLAWKRCNGQCKQCTRAVTGAGDIEFDHIIAWEISHDSSLANCQVLCVDCHQTKTATVDIPSIAAMNRKADFHLGIRGPGRGKSPLPGGKRDRDGRAGRLSMTIRNGVVPRLSQAEKHRRLIARRYGFDEIPGDPE